MSEQSTHPQSAPHPDLEQLLTVADGAGYGLALAGKTVHGHAHKYHGGQFWEPVSKMIKRC
jgi:hypothetical protein